MLKQNHDFFKTYEVTLRDGSIKLITCDTYLIVDINLYNFIINDDFDETLECVATFNLADVVSIIKVGAINKACVEGTYKVLAKNLVGVLISQIMNPDSETTYKSVATILGIEDDLDISDLPMYKEFTVKHCVHI